MDNITFDDVKKRAMSEGEEARLQLAYVMGERAGMIKAQSIYAKYLGNLTEEPEMKCEED